MKKQSITYAVYKQVQDGRNGTLEILLENK